MKRKKKSQTDAGKGIDLQPLCPGSLKRYTSSESVLSTPFEIVDLTAPHTHHLQIRSYFDFYGGYAEHARNILFGLNKLGKYTIKLSPIKTPVDIDPIIWQEVNRFINNPAFEMDKSEYLCIAGPGYFQKKYLPENRKVYGWTMIETLQVQKELVGWLEKADELWAPTDTDVRRFADAGLKNISKMHLGYDDKLYHEHVKPVNIPQLKERFVFGVLGSWNKRKGVKEIVQAFCKAFKKTDEVSLLLFCKYGTRPYENCIYGRDKDDGAKWTIQWELEKYLEEVGMTKAQAPHICVLDIPVHDVVVPHVLARFNCLLGFSRGESTWLPGLQAMAMRKPIIQHQNDCSGYMEYLEDVAFLCKDVTYEYADPELYLGTSGYYEHEKLAQGSVAELIEMMRFIYRNRFRHDLRDKGRIDVGVKKAKDWTWDKSIEAVHKRLTNA